MKNDREFFVDTPMGQLHVYAKHAKDHPEDYPGVYIDLVRPGVERIDSDPVCTVEYDSGYKRIQTVLFCAEMDTPTDVCIYAEEEVPEA